MKTKFLFFAVLFAAVSVLSCNNESGVLAVRLDKNKLELVKGETVQLHASVVPEQAASSALEWFSEDENYVKVDENGNVTAVALKRVSEDSDELTPVSVFVRYQNGADECEVTVLPLATEAVEIQKPASQIKIPAGSTVQLEAKCFPENADLTDLTWSSEWATVAVVDDNGLVTGKTAGFTYIKASYSELIYDEILITVEPVVAQSVSIEPAAITIPFGKKMTLKAVLNPTCATDKLIWTSDNNEVVKVIDSATGAVEAVGEGVAKIKVQADKVFAECEVTVTK